MGRRGRHSESGTGRGTWAVLGAGLLVGGVTLGVILVDPESVDRPSCGDRTVTATVAAAPDHVDVLRRIAADWQVTRPSVAGACAAVRIVSRESADLAAGLGTAAEAGRDGGRPDAWAPDSSAWVTLAATRPEAAALLPSERPSLATSPVVIAMPRDRATALGWPNRPVGWRTLLGAFRTDPSWGRVGHPEWGPFVLGMSDPTRSTAGLLTVLTLADTDGNGAIDDTETAGTLAFERSVGVYAPSEDLFARVDGGSSRGAAASRAPSAFPATEQSVIRHDGTTGASRLVPVYPADGTMVADHPYLVLRAPWVDRDRRAVAEAFGAVARDRAGQDAYGRAGFRDRDQSTRHVPRGIAGADPLPASYRLRPGGGTEPVPQTLVRWRALRRPANVIAAIDTSGSMAERAPGLPVTKLAVLQAAAVQAVGLFNDRSNLGLWEFATALTPSTDYRALVPPRPVGTTVNGTTQRRVLAGAVRGLRARGDTGLYDTIDAGYREMQRTWRPDQQNILVVMTDGKNDDPDGLPLDTLVERLTAARTGGRQVDVLTIAYGEGADVPALDRVSKAAGGRTYVCRNPADIGKVFLAAMVNR